jgi:hypothetical protein
VASVESRPDSLTPVLLLTADRVITPTAVLGDAVLVADGRIAAVGRAGDLRSEGVEEHSFPGATIVPGLRDAHLHPVGYAASLSRPILKSAPDFDAVADIVSEAAAGQPPGSAITALRLDDESLAEGRLPTRDLLDRVAPDRPVLLVRYCGHVSVANTAALALAGIGDDTPDPPGGSYDRDGSGRITGVMRETAADPVTAAIRPLAPPITADDLVDALHALASTGLTGVGAMVATDAGCWAGAGSELDALLEAAPRSPIDLGVLVIASDPDDLESAALRLASTPGPVRFLGAKMFSDGSLGGHTAAMHDGFADRPGERGTDRLDPEWARRLAARSLALGGKVAIHAIGDRANGGVLDLMERLVADGADPTDLRVEHASVLTHSDIARFGRLGVTASVQPAFIASETGWLGKRLGPERLARTYPFRSLADAGTPLAGGSDSPVEPPHPLPGMAAARDRCGIVPEEALDAAEALALFTSGAAAAIGADGTLAPGTRADLTVLDGDPLTASPRELRSVRPLAVMVGGTAVEWRRGTVAWVG